MGVGGTNGWGGGGGEEGGGDEDQRKMPKFLLQTTECSERNRRAGVSECNLGR